MTIPCTASTLAALAIDTDADALHCAAATKQSAPPPANDPALLAMLEYIDTHLGECDLGEHILCKRFMLSRATLYRRFQAVGGVARYIRERRLQRAQQHLAHNPGCSLTWLLYEMGFASERQFQRSFLAHFGMSAAHWRRRCQAG